jgi:hypothetical protein
VCYREPYHYQAARAGVFSPKRGTPPVQESAMNAWQWHLSSPHGQFLTPTLIDLKAGISGPNFFHVGVLVSNCLQKYIYIYMCIVSDVVCFVINPGAGGFRKPERRCRQASCGIGRNHYYRAACRRRKAEPQQRIGPRPPS